MAIVLFLKNLIGQSVGAKNGHFRTDIADMFLYFPNTFTRSSFTPEQTDITSIRLRIIGTNQAKQGGFSGYVSPEMHRAYLKNLPAIEIVASGLHDSIGLYKRPHQEQMAVCEWWMDVFGIASLKDKPFLQLSSGEQRLALLARAFVKDPELQ